MLVGLESPKRGVSEAGCRRETMDRENWYLPCGGFGPD
jgi:hypothetical protein